MRHIAHDAHPRKKLPFCPAQENVHFVLIKKIKIINLTCDIIGILYAPAISAVDKQPSHPTPTIAST